MGSYRTHVLVCGGAGCASSGCKDVEQALTDEITKQGLADEIRVIVTGCMGPCELGPIIIIYPEGVLYRNLKPDDARLIVKEHLLKGRIVDRLLYVTPDTQQKVHTYSDMVFFNRQLRIALRNTGKIDPLEIEEYIAEDGYAALAKVLSEMTPEDVINVLKGSGLRGRGGAGFPTGLKWDFTRRAKGDQKYVVCNADEGDPGAFMDRSIIEGDPHAIIEAMSIAGYTVGANQGYVYVRAEYPLAVAHLTHAINQNHNSGSYLSYLGSHLQHFSHFYAVCNDRILHRIMGLLSLPGFPRQEKPGSFGNTISINTGKSFGKGLIKRF
jgi:(2Fe-2S) ferredoxin